MAIAGGLNAVEGERLEFRALLDPDVRADREIHGLVRRRFLVAGQVIGSRTSQSSAIGSSVPNPNPTHQTVGNVRVDETYRRIIFPNFPLALSDGWQMRLPFPFLI